MPVTARHPYTPHIVATLANPGGGVAAEYDPLRFTLGETLYARNQTPNPGLHLLTLGNAGARFWFPITGPAAVAAGGDLAPMYFAGGIEGVDAPGGPVGAYLANDSYVNGTATQLRYVKHLSMGLTVRLNRVLAYVGLNDLSAATEVFVLRNGVNVATTTVGVGVTGAATFTPGAVVTLGADDQFDVGLTNPNGGAGNNFYATVTLEFTTV